MEDMTTTGAELEKTEISRGFWNTVRHYGRLANKGLERNIGTITSYAVGAPLDAMDNAPRLWGGDSISKRMTGEEWKPIDGIQGWYEKKQKEIEISRYGAPLKAEGLVENAFEFSGGMLLPVGGVLKAGGAATKTAAKGASVADETLQAGTSWASRLKDKVSAFTEARMPAFWINREKDIATRLDLLAKRAADGSKSAEKYMKLTVDQQRIAGNIARTDINAISNNAKIPPDIRAAMEKIYNIRENGRMGSQAFEWASSRANYVISHPLRTAGTITTQAFKHYKVTGAAVAAGVGYDYATNNSENAKALGAGITDVAAMSLYGGGQVVRMISPSLYEQAKKHLPDALKATASGAENVAGGFKAVAEGAGGRVSEIIGAENADAVKGNLSRAADSIPPSFVPGGVVVKDAVNVYQHRQDIKTIQGSIQSGETVSEALKGLAGQKVEIAEQKAEMFMAQADLPQQTTGAQMLTRVEERTKSLREAAKEKFEGAAETLQQKGAELNAGSVVQSETAGPPEEDTEIPATPAPAPGAETQPRPSMFARAREKEKKLKEEFGDATEAAREKLKQEREKFEQDMREQKETMLARMHEKEADLEKKFEERKAQLEQAGRQVVDTTKGVAMAGMLPDLGGAFRGAGKWLKELDLGLDAKQMGMAAVGVGMLFALGKWAFGSGSGNNAPASGGGSSTMETVGTVLGALALVAMAAMVYDAVKGGGKGETAPRNDRTLAVLPAPAPQ